jgi:hypothetical protein
MNRYGQSITWSALSAPAIFTGDILSYSYDDKVTEQELEDGGSDIAALALHSRKAEVNFEAEVTSGSTNFLDLSAGAALAVSGITGGSLLASRAVEKWALLKKKTASIQATHFPDMTPVGSPAMAGTSLSAFTPDQTGVSIPLPGAGLIYSTVPMTHAAGVIHELTLTQMLKITEDEPSPAGAILGAATHGYKRMISLLLLATGAIPAVGSTLAIGSGPAHTANYIITGARPVLERAKGKMYSIDASWITPFGS